MTNALLPYARTFKLLALDAQAELRLRHPPSERKRLPVRFLVGCGRSGTTILGKLFAGNQHAHYLREPYHLWKTIDRRFDVTGLHSDPTGARFFMDSDDFTERAAHRFDTLIARSGDPARHLCVVEKTPHNAARIGLLERFEPDARFVHIARDGVNVVRSIDRLASSPTYKMAWRSSYNQWWGKHGAKWNALASEGAAKGYFPDEVPLLKSNMQRGAYEWLASLCEVNAWKPRLGDRLLEVTYTQLTSDPVATCSRICDHIGVPAPKAWAGNLRDMVSTERTNKGDDLVLPPKMAEVFNELQAQYEFPNKAIAS